MLKKTITYFTISAAALLVIASLTLLTKAAQQLANKSDKLQTQKKLIILYIESANSISARTEFDNLIIDFGDTEDAVPAVYDIAEKYRQCEKYQSAADAYHFIRDCFPNTEQTIWSQRGLAICSIAFDDIESAEIDTQILINNYSDNENIAQAVFEIADAYYLFGKNQKARQLYQQVIDTWPNSQHAMWSQMGLAISFIADGNETAAEDAIDKLILNYPENEKLPETLFYVAGRYAEDKKYNEAQDIYYYIIDQFLESEWAKNAEFESAKVGIYPLLDENDEPNALAAIDNLIVDFADRNDLASAIYGLAERVDDENWCKSNSLTKAICQIIIDNFPDSMQSIFSEIIISRINIRSLIDSNDDTNALIAVDYFVDDFNDIAEQAGINLCLIAQRFYGKAMTLKAEYGLDSNSTDKFYKSISVQARVIDDLPISKYTPRAYFCSAVMFSQELGEYADGIELFEYIVNNWPEYKYADHVQYQIGKYYRRMLRDPNTPEEQKEQLEQKREQAYIDVIEKYPYSRFVKRSAYNLGHIYSKKKDWELSAAYYEIALQKNYETNEYNSIKKIISRLVQAYQNLGRPDQVKQLYQQYLDIAEPNDPTADKIKIKLQNMQKGL